MSFSSPIQHQPVQTDCSIQCGRRSANGPMNKLAIPANGERLNGAHGGESEMQAMGDGKYGQSPEDKVTLLLLLSMLTMRWKRPTGVGHVLEVAPKLLPRLFVKKLRERANEATGHRGRQARDFLHDHHQLKVRNEHNGDGMNEVLVFVLPVCLWQNAGMHSNTYIRCTRRPTF